MNNSIELITSPDDQDVNYLKFNDFSNRKVFKTLRLIDLIPQYVGADIYIDINEKNELIGFEILI